MELKNTFLKKKSSIKDAITILNKFKCQIVLIVNEKYQLLGTVTDGDIRRSIAKGNNLDCPLFKIMNRNPIKINSNKGFQSIQRLMKINSILQIPEVDKDNKILKMHYWNSKINLKKKKNYFFIMAGGIGKRLLPLTKNIPKPMLKIGNKPILENLINDAKNFGFYNFKISVNYKKDKIINYFKNGQKFNCKIEYIEETKPLGTAGSLALLKLKNNKLPIIMTNGDVLSNINYSELLDFHSLNKAFATVVVKQIEKTNSFGVVKTQGILFKNFIEKPIEKININTGIYVFNPKIVDFVPRKKIDIPEILTKLNKRNKKIIIFPVHEEWSDLGIKKDLKNARKKFI